MSTAAFLGAGLCHLEFLAGSLHNQSWLSDWDFKRRWCKLDEGQQVLPWTRNWFALCFQLGEATASTLHPVILWAFRQYGAHLHEATVKWQSTLQTGRGVQIEVIAAVDRCWCLRYGQIQLSRAPRSRSRVGWSNRFRESLKSNSSAALAFHIRRMRT